MDPQQTHLGRVAAGQTRPGAAWAARRRAAGALRRLGHALVSVEAPEGEILEVARVLEEQAGRLERHPVRAPEPLWRERAGEPGGYVDTNPLFGLSNALAPPLLVEPGPAEGIVTGRATLGAAYQGPQGYVHGGIVAAVFDEMLGLANSLAPSPGWTGTLSVRYKAPTPLATPLLVEARLEGVEGRRVEVSAELRAGERTTAEARATFVSVGGSLDGT